MASIPKGERKAFIDARINSDWGYTDYVKGPDGRSVRQIADSLFNAFAKEGYSRPSNMTIQRDIEELRAGTGTLSEDEIAHADLLLERENFPQFRAEMFQTPDGDPYGTPIHQLAAFEVMYSLTYKEALPEWVIEFLDRVDPDHPLPENINDLIVNPKVFLSFEFLMAPRHGKTELMIHFIIWVHMRSPEKRVMFGNGTEKKTQSFIANFIMPVLETHERLNELWGPFKGNLAWSKDGYILATRPGFSKMPSLQPYGLRGSIRSFDTDLIIGDDLSDYKRALSETTTTDDAEWVRTELMSRREPKSPFFNTGSHLPIETGDLFVHLEDKLDELDGNQVYIIKKVPAHNYELCRPEVEGDPGAAHGDWCVLWPEYRDWDYLEGMRSLMADDVMFEAVYNQIPASKGMQHFPKDVVRHRFAQVEPDKITSIKLPPQEGDAPDQGFGVLDFERSWKEVPYCCKAPVLVAGGFDPAKSKSKRAAFSAFSVKGGCPWCGRRYLIDYWEGKVSIETHPMYLAQFMQAYPLMSRLRIEINAYQEALAKDPRLQEAAQKHKVVIDEWDTDDRKWDPILGIPQMARHVKSGMYSVPFKTRGDQEYAERVLKQLIRWPKRPNDWVMADWFAELSLFEMIEEYRYVLSETDEIEDKWRSDWHDEQTWEVDLADIEDEDDDGWSYR